MARKYLLAIDGGGIRGIIPAAALVALEDQTGRPAREAFDFLAGTSTGAIIAGALVAGVEAKEILRLYQERAGEVFDQSFWTKLRRIVPGYMYSPHRLRAVIADVLGADTDRPLNAFATDLLITATHLRDGTPWYFVQDKPGHNSGRTGRLKLADCIVASAAEPTYFAPWTMPEDPLPPSEGRIGTLVGGGVGVAGNPVYQACVEAFRYSDPAVYRPEETIVVSLGTGRFVDGQELRWIWPWAMWVLAQLLRSPGEQQTQIAWRHFPLERFYRIDTKLQRDIPLDDLGSIAELRREGERLAGRIDWPAILAGTDTNWLVTERKTLFRQYSLKQPEPE